MNYFIITVLWLFLGFAFAESEPIPHDEDVPMESDFDDGTPFVSLQALGIHRFQTFSTHGKGFEVNGNYTELRLNFTAHIKDSPYFWSAYLSSVKGSNDMTKNDVSVWDYSNTFGPGPRNDRFSSDEVGYGLGISRAWRNQTIITLDLIYFDGTSKKEDCWYNIPGQEYGISGGCEFDTTGIGIYLGMTSSIWSHFHLQAGLTWGQRELKSDDISPFEDTIRSLSSEYYGAYVGFSLVSNPFRS